jgi:hypothetical protein
MKKLFVWLAILFAAATTNKAAALDDITGVWTVTDTPSVKVFIERQEDRLRVGVANARLIGLAHPWYFGNAIDPTGAAVDFIARAYNPSDVTQGRIAVRLNLSGPFSGTITINGTQYMIERRPLVANGLLAAIDFEAPETGWYKEASQKLARAFVEVQGRTLFVYRLQTNVRLLTFEKSGVKTWVSTNATSATAPTQIRLKIGKFDFSHASLLPKRTFVENRSADVVGPDINNNGLRDDIDSALTDDRFQRAKVRAAIAEIGRAYQLYLMSPSTTNAEEAAFGAATAKQCLEVLVGPPQSDEIPVLVKSLVFNTAGRHAAYIRFLRDTASLAQSIPSVSLQNPNACTSFMQGVIRRFDLLSPAQLNSLSAPAC